MKNHFLLLILLIVSSLAVADTTYYYVNIDNAPNGSASGYMKVYYYGEPYEFQTSTLTFLENYNGGMGGKYRSPDQLFESTSSCWITIKCSAKKSWGPEWLWGFSEQTFTGGSRVSLPTIHVEDPPTPPVDPPDPK